jgi:site-specific DNA recombinase
VTEAELVRDLFGRIATGEATMNAEANRMTALGVPRVQRYAANRKKGTAARVLERSGGWSFRSLAVIIHNAVYKGAGVLESKHGDLERPTPPLVDQETWERAQRALLANRNLSKRPESADYLLRGLVKCGGCGLAFCGAMRFGVRKYRCTSNSGQARRNPVRCPGGQIDAARLEALVWDQVKAFVRDPGPYVEAAQQQLRAQLADVSQNDETRKRLARDLAGKEQERDRVLALYRRGRITGAECDKQMDDIAREAREIREMADALQARADMATASEAYLSEVGAAVAVLRYKVDEIERTNDWAAMRGLIELLAPGIVIMTEVVGQGKGKARTRASVKLTLALSGESAAVPITGRPISTTRPWAA